jgi:cytochrome c556
VILSVDVAAFLKSLEDSGLAVSLRASLYYFPFLESIHVMALAVVFGTILVVDLRALGVASTRRPFSRLSAELLRLTWCAFAVSALTGALMFVTNARVYAHNTSFQIKMALLGLAGLNMALFHLTAGRSVARWDQAPAAPRIGRISAALSLLLWVGIIGAGRVIGFTTTGAQAKQAPVSTVNFDDFLSGGPGGPGLPAAAPASASAASAESALANLTIKGIMDSMVDPSGDFLFESIAEISDEHGIRHKAPTTPQDWENVRARLQILVDAEPLLIVPGRKAAGPADHSKDPKVENEPAQVQALLDAQHPDFVVRAGRLRAAAESGLTASAARDPKALLVAITAIDKACESCHLHYFYPNDKRAHIAAREEGGIIE